MNDKPLIISLSNQLKESTFLPIVNRLVEESNCKVIKTEWKLIYNSYVVYDYEPFCSDGFDIYVHITGDKQSIKFFEHIYLPLVSNIRFLERCYKNETVTRFTINTEKRNDNKIKET